jgi:hypothetical protein
MNANRQLNMDPPQLKRAYNHLLKLWLFAMVIICTTANVRASIIDDLFTWALQQPVTNQTSIKFVMTSNEITRNNLVSYSVGRLIYYPAHVSGGRLLPASFASESNSITQYFSDRTYPVTNGSLGVGGPFNAASTDPLTVSIGKAVGAANYSITLTSSKWGFTFSFVPIVETTTKILYGTMGNGFFTVSLGGQASSGPPKG